MTRDKLFDYLASDDNEFGLDPVATHGFLTACVVGRPLNNYLDVYFEQNATKVPQDIKDALDAWRDELYQTLKNENPIELPFDASDEEESFDDDADIVVWCIGFVDAMYGDDQNDWFCDPDSEEDVAELTLPMVILSGIDEDDEDLNLMRQDADMMAGLANSLENNVTELFLLFHTND